MLQLSCAVLMTHISSRILVQVSDSFPRRQVLSPCHLCTHTSLGHTCEDCAHGLIRHACMKKARLVRRGYTCP